MIYDADYFERGVESGKSLYSNYRWMPELTIPLAYELIKILGLKEGDAVLDFGCAKGYLVRAMHLLHIDAWGVDTSSYARGCAPNEIRTSLFSRIPARSFKATIAKDVFEHLSEHELDEVLQIISNRSQSIFVIVPLGDGERYVIPSYELDTTHVIRQPLEWWKARLEQFGFVVDARYRWGHIKENWYDHGKGNGFLLGVR